MSERRTIVAVFRDGTAPAEGEPLVPFVQNIGWPQYTDGRIYIDAEGQDGEAFSIADGALVFSVKARPTDTDPVISREATVLVSAGGSDAAYVPLSADDLAISAKSYGWTLTFVQNVVSASVNWTVVPLSAFAVEPTSYVPGQAVTVPEEQEPLAPGQGFTWRGAYDGGTAYVPYDVVSFDDSGVTSSFVCIASTTGNDPTDGTYWDLMASGAA